LPICVRNLAPWLGDMGEADPQKLSLTGYTIIVKFCRRTSISWDI